MGMPAQSVALLLIEHKRQPFSGPVLTYGVQGTNLTYKATLELFALYGIEPAPLPPPPDMSALVTIAHVFALLGIGETLSLDVSDYEGADIVANLNEPIAPELRGRFGLILDAGTMEHVFDIRQGMMNTADMLRVGGTAVHITPSNNYFNHGFVQVSPTLYHDYYRANAFGNVHGIVIVHPRKDYYFVPWKLVEYETVRLGGVNSMFCDNGTQLAIYFAATKTAESTSDVVPIQSYFQRSLRQQELENYQYEIGYDPQTPRMALIKDPPEPGKSAALDYMVGF